MLLILPYCMVTLSMERQIQADILLYAYSTSHTARYKRHTLKDGRGYIRVFECVWEYLDLTATIMEGWNLLERGIFRDMMSVHIWQHISYRREDNPYCHGIFYHKYDRKTTFAGTFDYNNGFRRNPHSAKHKSEHICPPTSRTFRGKLGYH